VDLSAKEKQELHHIRGGQVNALAKFALDFLWLTELACAKIRRNFLAHHFRAFTSF